MTNPMLKYIKDRLDRMLLLEDNAHGVIVRVRHPSRPRISAAP
jgi:hypothetical protein